MKTLLIIVLACLFFASPLMAEPPIAPEGTQSLSYLTSQAQKIKIDSTKEDEVIQLLGQPASAKTTKINKKGMKEIKILKYGPEKNLIIRLTDGVVTRVNIP